jgi:putative phosphoesterase
MKILVVSDTHGCAEPVREIVEKRGPFDALIHCGDVEGQENVVSSAAGCATYMVAGNNDWGTQLPSEIFATIGGLDFFVTHGHRYRVYAGPERLAAEAARRGADICLYGHTHVPMIERRGGLLLMNPGSLTFPRQQGRQRTYGIIRIDENGRPECEICGFEKK